VVFRADNFTQAWILLKAMYGIADRDIAFNDVIHGHLLTLTDMSGRDLLRLLVPGLIWVWLLPNSSKIRFIETGKFVSALQALAVLCLLYIAVDQFGNYSPFLYFQF
jgi:hypothetical protein